MPQPFLSATFPKRAVVLRSSEHHVNICLYSEEGEASVIKLSAVAPHKDILAVTKRFSTVEDLHNSLKDSNGEFGDKNTNQIKSFLSNFTYQLTSESGAEYSYYTIREKRWWETLVGSFSTLLASKLSKTIYTMELISPASDRQIGRTLPGECHMVEETPELYEAIVKPHIATIVQSGSLEWVANVVDGSKEKERLLLDHDDFILNIDTKWRSHPDPLTTTRHSWYGHSSVQDLYCLAIVKDRRLASMRDLRSMDLAMLTAILKLGTSKIEDIYGVPGNQLRVFCHYQPQFYQFHVHFTRLENEIGCQVERGHLLTDIIQNLQMRDDYYATRSITYKVKTSSELYKLLTQ